MYVCFLHSICVLSNVGFGTECWLSRSGHWVTVTWHLKHLVTVSFYSNSVIRSYCNCMSSCVGAIVEISTVGFAAKFLYTISSDICIF